MTAKGQQQDDMVNAFVVSIPGMQTDIALLKQDTQFLKEASRTQAQKSDTILDRLDHLSVVTPEQFETYKTTMDARVKLLEEYNDTNRPGVSFVNALVSRWTTFLVLLLLTAAVIVIAGKFVPFGI